MTEFSGLLLNLYQLAREAPVSAFQGHAMRLLRPSVAFDSGRWTSSVIRKPEITVPLSIHVENESPEVFSAWRQIRRQDTSFLDALRHRSSGPGLIYHSPTRYTRRDSGEMFDYQKRFGHQNVLNVYRKRGVGDQLFHRMIGLYRKREDHQFSRRDLMFVQGVMPHMLEALSINHAVHLPSVMQQAPASAFVLGIAEPDHRIRYRDPRLDELFRREWPNTHFGHMPDTLWGCLSRQQAYRGRHIVVVAETVQDMLFFKVRPSCAADNLSPRELEAARLVAAGGTHKTIAKALAVSLTTARNHMQHVHEKLAVHNTAEMIGALQRMH